MRKVILKINSFGKGWVQHNLCWVPGHTDLQGNAQTNRAVRMALSDVYWIISAPSLIRGLGDGIESFLFPLSDPRPFILKYIKSKWHPNLNWMSIQTIRCMLSHHALKSVTTSYWVMVGPSGPHLMPHWALLADSYVYSRENPPTECIGCLFPLTLRPILM